MAYTYKHVAQCVAEVIAQPVLKYLASNLPNKQYVAKGKGNLGGRVDIVEVESTLLRRLFPRKIATIISDISGKHSARTFNTQVISQEKLEELLANTDFKTIHFTAICEAQHTDEYSSHTW